MTIKSPYKILLCCIVLGLTSCASQNNLTAENRLSDPLATQETVNLYNNLIKLKEKGYLFGHQDDLAYGVTWKYEKGRSDVHDVTGDYPGIYGWDIGGLEYHKAKNIDGVPFDMMKNWIIDYYQKGTVTTLSWHMDNPYTMKNSWDITPGSLASILPNGSKHDLYVSWLDSAAQFLGGLKTSDGTAVPVLYRPFHELTGDWFWWCKNNATPEQFKEIWRFTVDHLRKDKNLHNLIIVYNTADFNSKEEFLEYYPGDGYVDLLSFDKYQYGDPAKDNSFVTSMQKQLQIMNEVASEKKMPIALAETGYEQIPYPKWWTDTLNKAVGDYKISFLLVWRNHGWQEKEKKMHYYAPYKGQASEKDFIDYYNQPNTLFGKDLTHKNLYKNVR